MKNGYRLIDTARIYNNEGDVGKAVRESGLPRDEVFVTTKLWNSDQGYESTLQACEASLRRLGLSYLDLYLIHFPVSGVREESWKAMTTLLKQGKCRAVGVSNFTVRHLEDLLRTTETVPAVNQVEFNPFLYQKELGLLSREENTVGGVQSSDAWREACGYENQGSRREILEDPRTDHDKMESAAWTRRDPEIR